MTTREQTPSQTEITKDTPDSVRQPAWHVAVIGVFTFGIYLVYWFYKTWRDLRNHSREIEGTDSEVKEAIGHYSTVRPWVRTLSFFLPLFFIPLCFTPLKEAVEFSLHIAYPVLMVFLVASLFKDIARLIPNQDSIIKKNAISTGLLLTLCMAFFLVLAGARDFVYLGYLLVVIPPAFAQHWLNEYWLSIETEPRALRNAFSAFETIAIIIGALWLGLVVFGLMGVTPAN